MLDPKDIRIGNWVIKITGKDFNTNAFFEYKPVALDEHFFAFANICFPINLSPTVLGECGFKHEFGDWYKNIDAEGYEQGLPFLRYRYKDQSWFIKDMRLPFQPVYLHQLQNLFYVLTNQELDIRLANFINTDIIGPINFFGRPAKKDKTVRELL